MDRSTADGRRGVRAAAEPPCPCWPGRASLFLAGAGGQATRALLLLVDKGKGTQDSRVPTGGDTSLLDFPLKKPLFFIWIGFGQTNKRFYVMSYSFAILICSYVSVYSYVCGQIANLFLSETNF